jgi:hypothetical protein
MVNVGIGTTNPNASLHIDKAVPSIILETESNSNDPIITLKSSGPITGEGAQLWYDNSVGTLHIQTTYPNNAADIVFHTATGADKGTGNVRMVITGDGNVGIGITDPEAPLHILGGYDANNPKSLVISGREHASTVYSGIQFERAGGGTFFGIGNDSRTDRDEIVIGGGFGSVTNASSIKMYTGGLGSTVGTARMVITSSGNVGIGTTGPDACLHVNGDTHLQVGSTTGGRTAVMGSTRTTDAGALNYRAYWS